MHAFGARYFTNLEAKFRCLLRGHILQCLLHYDFTILNIKRFTICTGLVQLTFFTKVFIFPFRLLYSRRLTINDFYLGFLSRNLIHFLNQIFFQDIYMHLIVFFILLQSRKFLVAPHNCLFKSFYFVRHLLFLRLLKLKFRVKLSIIRMIKPKFSIFFLLFAQLFFQFQSFLP